MDMHNYFLCELKDKGIIAVKHVSGDKNEVDIFTKNTSRPVYEKHICKFVGDDEYMTEK